MCHSFRCLGLFDVGGLLICSGARIAFNPQQSDWPENCGLGQLALRFGNSDFQLGLYLGIASVAFLCFWRMAPAIL
jgi:hypothetical protein